MSSSKESGNLRESLKRLASQVNTLQQDLSDIQRTITHLAEKLPSAMELALKEPPESKNADTSSETNKLLAAKTPPETSAENAQAADFQGKNFQENTAPKTAAASHKVQPSVFTSSSLERALAEKTKTGPSFELTLGIKWFSRLGIVAVLIGLAMLLSYTFNAITTPVKILMGWSLAAGLFYGGNRLYQSMPVLGRVLQGGGLSIGYLTLYAMFFFPAMQIMDAPILGISLLLTYVGFTIVLSHRLSSQTTAFLSLILGYYTASYSGSQAIALISTGIISTAALTLTALHPQWRVLNKSSLLGAMGTYLYWNGLPEHNIHGTLLGVEKGQNTYLWFTFLLFHIGSFFPKKQGDTTLNLLNTFSFYILYFTTGYYHAAFQGDLELTIALLQLGSFIFARRLFPEKPARYMADSCIFLCITFAVFTTCQYFEQFSRLMVISSQAFLLGYFSRKGFYPKLFYAFSLILYFVGWVFWCVTFSDHRNSPLTVVLSSGWYVLSGLLLEHFVYRNWHLVFRVFMLSMLTLIWWVSLREHLDPHWVTVSYSLTAFSLLVFGFLVQERRYRIFGILWLAFAGLRILFHDIDSLDMPYKIIVFLLMGFGLLGASYGYSLLEKHLKPVGLGPEAQDDSAST